MTLNIALPVALGSGIIFTQFELLTFDNLYYITYVLASKTLYSGTGLKAHSHQARLRPSTRVDGRLRRYGTHAKKRARSHQARLRPSKDVDGRLATSDHAVLINGQIKRVDAHRRASTSVDARGATDVDARRRT